MTKQQMVDRIHEEMARNDVVLITPGGGIKTYSSWPPKPQLNVNGELLGGSDFFRETYEAEELQNMLAKANPSGAEMGV